MGLMGVPERSVSIEQLFDPVAVSGFEAPSTAELVDALPPPERDALGVMSEARRAEFATARACAHAAMAVLGVDGPVGRGAAGEPQWPHGVRGSISHTRGFCLAVVTTERHSIGIDVEEIHRVSDAVERRVLVDAERRCLGDLDESDRRRRIATIFAAKEAFYKAHYALDPRYLGFDAVTVSVEGAEVRYSRGSGAVGHAVLEATRGRCRYDQGRVIVAATIPAAFADAADVSG